MGGKEDGSQGPECANAIDQFTLSRRRMPAAAKQTRKQTGGNSADLLMPVQTLRGLKILANPRSNLEKENSGKLSGPSGDRIRGNFLKRLAV
jgi:hypothetical protein